MNKSASVREVGYGRGRNLPFQPTSTPASRLKAREIELEKDCQKKTNKQSPWGNFVIDTNLPFRAVESFFANPLMDTIREYPQVRAPSAYEIAELLSGVKILISKLERNLEAELEHFNK
ncbi:Poly-beta-1 6-N-acetyl-D-glucosamine synthase [Bienertia sinuspersici]